MSVLPGIYWKNNIRVINWTRLEQDFVKYVLSSLIGDIETNKKIRNC
jgi:hypothetical protein